MDKVEEVPLGILSETTRSDGLGVMLQEKSFGTLQNLSVQFVRSYALEAKQAEL
jgi:hypothetical protein